MLLYPAINPIAIRIGPVSIHWYGLMYLLGFTLAYLLARWRIKHNQLSWRVEDVGDLIFYGAMGVIVGGRIGYMVFYNFPQWVTHPLDLFKLWQGGMSFHGGLVGVILALWLFSHKIHKPLLEIGDLVAPLVPLGLAAGRAGNFINGELWGRPTNMPWGMIFPNAADLPRHPSQLYELGLEGLLLFVIVWCYAATPRPRGAVSAVFLIGYACCRLIAECFREPDLQLGFFVYQKVTMGQLLSLPMLIAGLWLLRRTQCKAI